MLDNYYTLTYYTMTYFDSYMYIVCLFYCNSFFFLYYIFISIGKCIVYRLLFCTLLSHCTAGHCEFLLRGINKGLSYLIFIL